METIKKWLKAALVFMLKFWEWKIWKRSFWGGKTEFLIPFIALCIWLFFAAGGMLFGWTTYPVGYFQKLTFGVFGMSLISAVAWIWLKATFPHLKAALDPDTMEYQELNTWEKVKIAFWLFAWYSGGAVLLASLY